MGSGTKVQGTVSDYHDWVITQLIDRLAPDRSRVVAAIISSWVTKDPDGAVKQYGLTYEAYQEATRPEQSASSPRDDDQTGGKVLQYEPRAAGGNG